MLRPGLQVCTIRDYGLERYIACRKMTLVLIIHQQYVYLAPHRRNFVRAFTGLRIGPHNEVVQRHQGRDLAEQGDAS